ncbi:signal recognition particle-docking protein FtsY [Enterobacteriaceae endosymbiont of Macroplea appendiculata]|uniref:signal recognition particle-docking protein FtsY n=1 Tax=Enterobacteriaceae endosymbiont of Macroplea appendiculata TaxID=2675790 RepID=UPI0014494131|nr:signal recognition particle-docking protein FtsY [Enterobacteriaceae endosymbiont of Macroplea appendiculata]QJC30657.1 signal recognition particle-docking protein FtsY [Enterobacteriaceae endosymbiont of Macroplea appendiculata]
MIIKKDNCNKKNSFLRNLTLKIWDASKNIGENLIHFITKNKTIDINFFNNLEKILIQSDISYNTTRNIVQNVMQYSKKNKIYDHHKLYLYIKQIILKILIHVEQSLIIKNENPYIILVIGVNGVGKTTTIGKLAYYFYKQNRSVFLASGDTFRAAASQQLKLWSQKSYSNMMIPQYNKIDSSAVIYDAIQQSQQNNADILIIDTAGRAHNNIALMQELKKNVKIIRKKKNHAPHEIMLVLDAHIGQNAINQFKEFHKHIGITGIVLTKMDGTAKGGIIITLSNDYKIPIRYIGTGEQITDLHLFNAKKFINTIFINN